MKEVLARCGERCQGAGMAKTPDNGTAGGFFIAIGAILGVIVGRYWGGQTTIGMLIGLATGGVIALAMWLRGRQ